MYTLPIREKYIDEHFNRPLMIFGTSEKGGVDVCTADGDTVFTVPYNVAEALIEADRKYMQEVYRILGPESPFIS